jgi:hypothetical protein
MAYLRKTIWTCKTSWEPVIDYGLHKIKTTRPKLMTLIPNRMTIDGTSPNRLPCKAKSNNQVHFILSFMNNAITM